MTRTREGHVLLGVNVLVLGYLPAAWQSPLLKTESFVDPEYWTRIGQLAEKATLDAVFLADRHALGDPGHDPSASRLDPTVAWAHVARATENVGLIATASTTFNDPYELASRLLSLDHVSGGRAAWNVVTSRDTPAANNFGLGDVLGRSDRYTRAAEFVDLVISLWDSASTGETVIHHEDWFDLEGRLAVPASPQGRPVIFQAGGSPQGRELASRAADGVFAAELTLDTAIAHYEQVKSGAEAAGRRREEVKIMPGLLLSLGSTEEEARRRSDALHDAGPAAYSAAWLSQSIGIDVAALELDERFPDEVLNGPINADSFKGSIGFRESIIQQIKKTKPTVREYLRQTRYTGSGHGGFVGTPEQLVDRIELWYRTGAADGLNLQPDVLIDGLEVIADEVVPLLRQRGLYRHEYQTHTLRGHFAAAETASSGR